MLNYRHIFPLTLTLSPRRGNSNDRTVEFQTAHDSPTDCRQFSLSRWERAGVRGIMPSEDE